MKILHSALMMSVLAFIATSADADETESKSKGSSKTPTKDRNTLITSAGMTAGKIVKVTDTQITLKVDEVVTTPGPNRTVTVNGRHVSVPSTKSKTVQKNYDYALESDVKLVTLGGSKKDNPKTVQELKEGDFVKLHLLRHSQPVSGGKPEIKIFVSQVDYTAPTNPNVVKK